MRTKHTLAAATAAAVLSISAAAVADDTGNHARADRGGKARQSSTDLGAAAERAIDGNTSGAWGDGSLSNTAHQKDPWHEVDLGGERTIASVVIYNRTDCCGERLSHARVELTNDPCDKKDRAIVKSAPLPMGSDNLVPTRVQIDFDDDPSARYVCTRMTGPRILTLAEVQVYSMQAAAKAEGEAFARAPKPETKTSSTAR